MHFIFYLSFLCCLLCLISISLLVHAILGFFVPQPNPLKRMAAAQVFVSFIGLLSGAVGVMTAVVVRTSVSIMRWWFQFLIAFIFFAMIYTTYAEYPQIWTGFVRYYNLYLGPYVHNGIIVPLQIVDLILRAVLPIWDSVQWFFKAIFTRGFLPLVLAEIRVVFNIVTGLADFIIHSVMNIVPWLESFTCTGGSCLVPETHVIDVVAGMGDIRKIAVQGSQLVRALCSTVAFPLDVVLYPFTDMNFGLFVHDAVNALLQLYVVIPFVTAERCTTASAWGPFHIMMCTPDLEPFFQFFIAGIGNAGVLVDNWLNVAFAIVKQAITGVATVCDSVDMVGLLPPDVMSLEGFASRRTATVGLMDWTYAVTDGESAVYVSSSTSTISTQMWPYVMDVSLGVAAIVFSGSQTMDIPGMTGGSVRPGALQVGFFMKNVLLLDFFVTDYDDDGL